MRGLGLWLLGAVTLPGPAPREGELYPWGHRAQLHPAPAEEQGPSGLWLHGDLHGCQWLRGDGAASRAGPLLLSGPRGGAPGLSRQPQHLRRPQVGSDLHLIEPLDEGGEGGRHAVYQAEHLLQTAGTCGVSDDSLGSLLGPRTAAVFRPRPGGSVPSRETRYVELYVVVDNAEFQMLGSEAAVRHRVLEVVNHVDKLYQKLNFRVVLVGLEIWNSQDRFHVSPNPSDTLENLLAWQARQLTRRHLHDNVQFITGVDFTGTTVGFARVSAMCSHSSGAVNQDHSKNPMGVACTMAHEMGHNLGMDHDENVQGCRCQEHSKAGRCIMAGSIGSSFPRMFSDCSQAYLESFLERPQSACLANAPDLSHLVGGPVCGNLFVERGEQCDCGPPEDCRNRCCNSTTCQLAEGAQCAHGTCCQECRVEPAGEPCRPKKDTCDLEEFCDGRHPECPEDAFQENGTPCSGGYCYNGTCPTLAQQCQAFWGPGGQAAEESCFSYDILPGCKTSRYRADMCGVLQCKGGQQPLGRGTCTLNSVCHALTTEDGTAYEPVPEGTQCGPEKVCNHKQECHCHAGWAPPHCATLLMEVHEASGSLPVFVVVVLVLLAVVLVTLAGIIVYRKAGSRILSRNVAPKTTMGRSNPLFHQAASRMPAKGGAPAPSRGPQELVPTIHPGQPAGHLASSVALKRPPPAPPVTVSSPLFPVPVYTWQAPKQGAVGPKVALKPPIQRKQGAGALTAP
ncbi:disintegrin and metalloproteinase domain-containing protein 8 isoform X3 [Nomascus leucogenys]|uniref:disintegrin and metalloproteinase domain-containing protein 8 isoform X3 n=1 Tax=Nomascus leucogenys TaxID=61853 RepID=UPI00122D9662|nr:disintegrin and metalloproteinase domain-containing protein 8 isoform X3 [Nomascus leucogenys]